MKKKHILHERSVIRSLIISILVSIFFVGIFLVYYNMVCTEKRDNIIKDGEAAAVNTANDFSETLSTYIDIIELAAYNVDEMLLQKKSNKEIVDYLIEQSNAVKYKLVDDSTGLYGYINGEYLDGGGWEAPADYDATERPWYQKTIKNIGKITVVEPYFDMQTKKPTMALAQTLCDTASVIAHDMSLSKIQKKLEKAVEPGSNDIEFIIDPNYNVVGHSDTDEIGKNYKTETGTLGAAIIDKFLSADEKYFEFSYNDLDYIAFSASIRDGWYCVSVKDTTKVFSSLTMILILTILIVVAIVMTVGIVIAKYIKRVRINEHLSQQLSSTSDIYISVHEVDLVNNTFNEVRSTKEGVAEIIGDKRNDAQQLIRMIMEKFSDPSTRDVILDFVDFSKLDEKLRNRNTITAEFLSREKKWRRARYIVSGRLNDGRVSNAMYLIEDIDSEKRDRDTAKDAAEMMNEQISSIANIYFSMHDIDLVNDRFREIKTDTTDISDISSEYLEHAQQLTYSAINRMTAEVSREIMHEFADFSTLDSRLKNSDSITEDFLSNKDIWCRARFVASKFGENGRIEHVLLLIENIDEQKRKRDELTKESKILGYRISSITNIYQTAHEIDIVNDRFTVIKEDNTYIQKLLRKTDSAQEMLRIVLTKLCDQSCMDDILKFIDLSTMDLRLKNIDTVTIEYMHKDKHWRRGRFVASRRDEEGSLTHVLWLVEDINLERQVRDNLIGLSERAIAANEAKSAFLSNMSHEIRTPINAVLGMNEMILRECGDENVIGYAENIKSAGSTLLDLINDILDFSKIEAGKMEITPFDYDVSSLINDLVNMIQKRVDDKGLELVLEIDRTIPDKLCGDEIRIKQIITNILTNAVKYTDKGYITFRIRCEKIENEPDSIMLKVTVKDTGIGMKKEDMDKLFSKFDRMDEEHNRNVEGTGLGMSITQRLLEMMNSELEVESVYEIGSSFSFSIMQEVVNWQELGDYEAAYKESVNNRQKYREKFKAPEAKVLVVDDTPMNLIVFTNLLKQTGVQIDTAKSGDDGLLLASEKKYDIIFLDHMMPEKDGIETIHELKQQTDSPNIETPVVCLTANAILGSREKYLMAGFSDYITKPIDPEKLEELLLKHLPGELIEKSDDDEAAVDTAKIPTLLYDIKEINTDIGVKNCGTVDNYISAIIAYARVVSEYTDEMESSWKSGNMKKLTTRIHSIKSTSKIIGADDLSELAKKLELAGIDGDKEKVGEGIDELISRYKTLGEALQPFLLQDIQEKDSRKKPAVSDRELHEAYVLIKKALDSMQFNSVYDIVISLKDYEIPDSEKERVNEMIRTVETYDYDKLPEILK